MRILMITDVFFPRINGVSTSIQLFRKTLVKMGHEVTLIAPDYRAQRHDDDIFRVPSRKVILDPEDRLMSRKYIARLIPDLRTMDFDLIHIQTPFVAHYAGKQLAEELDIPCVESYHTFFEEYLYHYFPYVPKSSMRYLARHFTRQQCNSVDAVISPSSAMHEALLNYGVNTPIDIIPTGLDLTEFKPGNGAAFRKKYAIDPERPVIVHIGRTAHEKNIAFLLTMLSHLQKKMPDILLLIAGEGPALSDLKKQVAALGLASNVMFIGYLSRDSDLPNCYCAGDAFVFASRTETQGLVLLESMALGVPVVSTAVMGTKDILAPHKGGIVSVEDPAIFSDEVHRLLTNPLLRMHLANQAREYVKDWTAEEMTRRLIRLYDGLLAREPYKLSARR